MLPKDLQEDIAQQEQELKEYKNRFFQLQSENLKLVQPQVKKKTEPFVRPQKIILTNDVSKRRRILSMMSMLTGVEVTSYVAGEHCCVVFHMQDDSQHAVKHGMRIEMQSGTNIMVASSLPLGFNINAVIDVYDNIMLPECFDSVWRALAAYHCRLNQFEELKAMFSMETQLFKVLDGSHMEITFAARSDLDPNAEDFELVLILDYRVHDIKPKQYTFREKDIPEGASQVLTDQCLVFKKKPLCKAFTRAFVTGIGPYKLVQNMSPTETEVVRKLKPCSKPNKYHYNMDDTFYPDDCPVDSEDDEMHNN